MMIDRDTNRKIFLLICAIVSLSAYSQPPNVDYIQTIDFSNYVHNSTLITGDSLKDFAFLEINTVVGRGNINNVRAPKGYNRYGVFAKGTRELKGFIFNGHINYSRIKDLDRKWCSMYDYDTRFPYYPFDTIAGDWNKNDLFMSASLSKPYLFNEKLSVGIKTSYRMTTGAKQVDPRPLTRNNEINISPSFIYHPTKNIWLGFDINFNKSKETVTQNYLNIHSPDIVFAFTGLGSLTIGGRGGRYFNKSALRPELLVYAKKNISKYMCVLYYDNNKMFTNVKWHSRPKPETTINSYQEHKIGASFVFDTKQNSFNHLLNVNANYIFGIGKSIMSTGINEHTGLIYDNDQLLPYHSDNSFSTDIKYSIFRIKGNNTIYNIRSTILFNRENIEYSGGINNLIRVYSLKGNIFYQHFVLSMRYFSLAFDVQASYYYPFSSEKIIKTTFTSSKYANLYYDYLTNNIFGYGVGISVFANIKKRDYNLVVSYGNDYGKKRGFAPRHSFNAKIITYF